MELRGSFPILCWPACWRIISTAVFCWCIAFIRVIAFVVQEVEVALKIYVLSRLKYACMNSID